MGGTPQPRKSALTGARNAGLLADYAVCRDYYDTLRSDSKA